MGSLDKDILIKDLGIKLDGACHEIGWGWGNAWVCEIEGVLSACKRLEEIGEKEVFEKAVELVKRYDFNDSARKLISYTEAYIKNIENGKLEAFGTESEQKVNVDYLRGVLEKFNEFY